MNYRTLVTIPAGQSVSEEIDVSDSVIVGIVMPDTWTAANITFLAAARDDQNGAPATFVPIHDAAGTELSVTTAANRMVSIAPDATRPARRIKLRSGTTATPVNQLAARTLIVVAAMEALA